LWQHLRLRDLCAENVQDLRRRWEGSSAFVAGEYGVTALDDVTAKAWKLIKKCYGIRGLILAMPHQRSCVEHIREHGYSST